MVEFQLRKRIVELKTAHILTSPLLPAHAVTANMDSTDKRFIVGVVLIVSSLVLGKLVFIPLLMFPGNERWYIAMLIVYIFSWLILITGIILTGIEGYKLVMEKYKEYQKRTVADIKKRGSAVRDKLRRKKNS